VIFASGFAGSALEMVLLLGMQTLAGSAYQQVVWVVTLFMAGLAVGAWASTRRIQLLTAGTGRQTKRPPSHVALCLLAVAIAAAAALLPMLLPAMAHLAGRRGSQLVVQGILLVYTFGLAAIVGAQFPLANVLLGAAQRNPLSESVGDPGAEINSGVGAARLYTADFVGASLGALSTGLWLVPLLGVAGVCWISAGLNLIAALLLLRRKFS
jgi:hypothetical protein